MIPRASRTGGSEGIASASMKEGNWGLLSRARFWRVYVYILKVGLGRTFSRRLPRSVHFFPDAFWSDILWTSGIFASGFEKLGLPRRNGLTRLLIRSELMRKSFFLFIAAVYSGEVSLTNREFSAGCVLRERASAELID